MRYITWSRQPLLSSLFLSFVFIACFAAAARAQSALDGFDPNINGTVKVVIVQPDGKILIAGDFTLIAPNGGASVTRNRIARMNPDGTLDAAFNPNANLRIEGMALQADGKIVVGGAFSIVGGQPRNRIARLDATSGSADAWDPNANNEVDSISVQADGKILTVGAFNSIGGQTRNFIARLDATTAMADSFNPNPNNLVRCVAIQADGKILAGGDFSGANSIGGQTRNRIARLNAATGTADSFDPNANGVVRSIAVQADGKVLAGGDFNGTNSIGGQTHNFIARLDAASGLADSFNPNMGATVDTIVVQADGHILVGGNFLNVGVTARNHLARFDPISGAVDLWDPNTNGVVFTIAVQPDRKILVGGFFTTLSPNGAPAATRNRIARLAAEVPADADSLGEIPDSDVESPGCQNNSTTFRDVTFTVSGVSGTVSAVVVNFNASHTFLQDLEVTLTAPSAQQHLLFSVTGNTSVSPNSCNGSNHHLSSANTYTFADSASANWWTTAAASDPVATSINRTVESGFGGTAGDPPPVTFMSSAFAGAMANGTWTLRFRDRGIGNTGTVTAANLFVSTVPFTPTNTPTNSPTGTPSNAPTNTPTNTPTSTPTNTPLPSGSALDGFDPNANGAINVIVVQPDGKILIGGDFTTLSPQGAAFTRRRIARLNPDGTLDMAFNPNANSSVVSIVVQADGKILVGGAFSGTNSIGGQTRNYIARLDAVTGAADSFDPNPNDFVRSIAVQADGNILVGGDFNGVNSIGGQPRNRIARLDPTTGMADSFNPNSSASVFSMAVQADGKVLAGGGFTGIGGATRNHIARLDAATGMADPFDPNASGAVLALAVQADGKVLASGGFNGANSIGGQTRNFIARLDAVTGMADSWDANSNGTINTIALQPDGKVLAAGFFTSIGGQTRTRIARLDPTTAIADLFDPVANSTVNAIAVQQDGKVLAGGIFTNVGAATRNRIVRLETDGRLDQTLDNLGLTPNNGTVSATAVQPDGKILIGGSFSSVLGVTRNNIARLNTDGTVDTAYNPNANSGVGSIAVQADGKILIGGGFTSLSPNGGASVTRNHIARLNADGTLDTAFDPNANNGVGSIVVQADGKILVGGGFSTIFGSITIGGQTRNRIARLDPVTGMADSFDPDADVGFVASIAVQTDGKILVGGSFTNIGGQSRNRIARLDANTGSADSWDPNANGPINVVVVQPDGKILVGGSFTNIGGQTHNLAARLDAATGLPDPWFPVNFVNGPASVDAIAVQADGKILVGENFRNFNGTYLIARVDGTTGSADSFNSFANVDVLSIAVQADGKILAGGEFDTIGGRIRYFFARLRNDTAALQNLAVTQTAVTWTRSGSSPQFSRVTFESSIDNVNYTPLGNGTAGGNNWTLTGLNLPTGQNLFIRARGRYPSGASESIQESVRNVFIAPGPAVNGTITYGNAVGNPPPPRFVRNVTVQSTAGSPMVGPVITGTPGTYTLTGFGATSYTIKPTKPGGANTAITSADAARVAQGVAGSVPFVSQNQRFAADTSGNGGPNPVSSQDAAFIARFAAGLTGFGRTGQWFFFVTGAPSPMPTAPATYNDSRTYASVTSNLTGEDYVAILVGEVTGNYNPANNARPAVGPEQNVSLELPQIAALMGKEVVVPMRVQGAVDKNITSYEFDLRYDPSIIQPLADPVDVAKTASRGLSFVTNANEPGRLRVVMYGAYPIDEDGVLLNLRFTAVGKPGSASPLSFERIMFNEGEPEATASNGLVELF